MNAIGKTVLLMQENLLMMLSGLVKMEQELTWIICVRQLSLLLKVELQL